MSPSGFEASVEFGAVPPGAQLRLAPLCLHLSIPVRWLAMDGAEHEVLV